MNILKNKCSNCNGVCCKIDGVYLTKEDVKILKEQNIDLTDKVKKSELDRFIYKLKKDKNGWCVFYQKNKGKHCSIYNFRSQVCKNYSIGRCSMKRIK